MKTANKTIELSTQKTYEFIDITDQIKAFIVESGIKEGIVNIQLMHTSAGLIVNENEPLLLEDIKVNLRNNSCKDIEYHHDDFTIRTGILCANERKNGNAHCNAIHLLVSATLNLINGELQLGQWQRIILIELDSPRNRKFQIQIIGE
jgi:secondary thiamine-phosphate synthase enzyme